MSISIDCVSNIKEILERGDIISLIKLGEEAFNIKAIKTEADKYRLICVDDSRPVFVYESGEEIIYENIEELVSILSMIECEDIIIN